MGCTFDAQLSRKNAHNAHENRRGRTGTIDTRKISCKVADNIIENVNVSNELLTSVQITYASTCLQKGSLFSSLTEDELRLIASLLVPATTKKGQYVFQQGDQGNCFFLIQNGQIEVEIDGKHIKTLVQGQTFGEISLILKAKRSASIRAKTDCKFLVMKPLLFRQTIQKIKINEYETKRNSIQQVQIFQGLTNKQKLNLANALKIMIYQKGQRILTKNELANAFYIINEGKVVVQLLNHEDVNLGKNECFGQTAFRARGRRKGSVIAVQRTVCSMISKDDFQKNSGTKAQNIYFYNLKKWALKSSQVFKNFSKKQLNTINLAFETQYAERNTRIKNNGLVVCLEGRINGISEGEHIFGDKEWKQGKENIGFDLTQEENGYYAYLSFRNFHDLLLKLEKKRESKTFASNFFGSNKQNIGGALDLSNFEYLKNLGQGQFGTVKLVRDPAMQRLYALKQISKKSIKKEGLQNYIEEEKKILHKIEFPFIVGFVKAFSDQKNIYFLMEYLKGAQLFSVIRQLPSLNKPIARYFFASLLLAVEHLHSHSIIYRDIKPENSVVDHTGKVYLIDMGTAKFLQKEKSYRTFTIIGTPHYMSPEVFSANGYSFESDIWSLGVLMYELLFNKLPFGEEEEDTYKVMETIKKDQVKFPKNIDSESEVLLKMMLNKNAKQRALNSTFQNIKSADYFNGFSWQDMLHEKIYPPYIPKEFKKQGGIKTINMEGKPLTKQLYPTEYQKKIPIVFKEWNERISF